MYNCCMWNFSIIKITDMFILLLLIIIHLFVGLPVDSSAMFESTSLLAALLCTEW